VRCRRVVAFVAACGAPPAPPPRGGAAPLVAVVAPPAAPAPVVHGIERLRAALVARGLRVIDDVGQAQPDFYVTLTIDQAGRDPEALSIARSTHLGRPALELRGGGARGLMYAALDTADRIAWSADPR